MDELGQSLIEILNSAPDKEYLTIFDGAPKTERIDTQALGLFVKQLQQLQDLLASYEVPDKPDAVSKLRRSINRFFDRYDAKPVYEGDWTSPLMNWMVQWVCRGPSDKQRTYELIHVLNAAELARAGRISAVKECEHCHKWLFARFSHQRFCSDSCKENFHRFNEADKKRRREWAKNNYWLHKHKNIK